MIYIQNIEYIARKINESIDNTHRIIQYGESEWNDEVHNSYYAYTVNLSHNKMIFDDITRMLNQASNSLERINAYDFKSIVDQLSSEVERR